MSSNITRTQLSFGNGPSVVRKTLHAWGVIDAQIVLGEGGEGDALTLVEGTADFNQSAFSANQRIEFWDQTGTRRFSGDLVIPGEEMVEGQLRVTWTAKGPTRRMSKKPFKQPRSFYVDPTIEESAVAASDTATVILNRVPSGGVRTTLRDEIEDVFTQAAAAGCYVFTNELEVPAQELPESRERVAKLADVLSVLARSCPVLSMSWEYESNVQLSDVRARWRRYVPETEASQTGAMKIGNTFLPKRRVDVSEISARDGLQVEALNELMVPVLRVQFVWRHVYESDGRQFVRIGMVEQVSTIENGAFGEECITVELRSAAINNGEVTSDPEPVPAGNFAEWLHPAYGRLWHKAQWTIHGDSCDFSVKIGELWEITGLGRTVEGVCISVTHEIARGRTTVVIGPPQRLSIMSLPLSERLRAPSNEYGRGEDEEDGSPSDPSVIAESVYRMPFDVRDITTSLSVVPGLLNGVAPDTIDGTAPWTFERLAGKIFLKVVLEKASGSVVTRELKKAASVPAPSDDGSNLTGYLELASISMTGDTLTITPGYNGSRWAHIAWGKVTCSGGLLTQPASLVWS